MIARSSAIKSKDVVSIASRTLCKRISRRRSYGGNAIKVVGIGQTELKHHKSSTARVERCSHVPECG